MCRLLVDVTRTSLHAIWPHSLFVVGAASFDSLESRASFRFVPFRYVSIVPQFNKNIANVLLESDIFIFESIRSFSIILC